MKVDVPPVTIAVVALNVAATAAQFALLDAAATRRWTLCARCVLHDQEWYRVVTSAFLHGGLLHVGMNMFSVVAIGSMLEQQLGSARLGLWLLWAVPLCGAASCGLASMLILASGDAGYERQHSLGFSGVIFAMAVLEVARSPAETRSVLGFFNVPAKLYPWAMLVLMQVLLPNVSFVGHLGGLLVGFAETQGLLWCLAPSRACEAAFDGALERRCPGYVATVAETRQGAAAPHCAAAASSAGGSAVTYAWWACTGLVVVTGRVTGMDAVCGAVATRARRCGASCRRCLTSCARPQRKASAPPAESLAV
ncbi:hypothetical protein M885DRAFT_461626 [Pelagophyceae sp. CCMP2097]|nr:hypothetical protein M885DRAFT_461626 [Pelagophyceae sp. CCMP2097]|mmetsp:Transcript_21130/g.75201  ORF Transcript_21130/g.75201 Transcript_21130/m.75201 type:complete len:309 (+) Transcript_21130:247-1173(+)